MITRISHVNIFVKDQNEALRFYTEALGFVIRADMTVGNYRWLTVGPKNQPDIELTLTALKPGDMLDEEAARAFTKLLDSGKISGGVLKTDDLQKFYDEATAKGVEFTVPPRKQPYGFEAVFKDNSGNWFSITEEISATEQPPS